MAKTRRGRAQTVKKGSFSGGMRRRSSRIIRGIRGDAMKYRYMVTLRPDPETEGVFLAEVPALPGCHSWGRSREEAIANARDAILCVLRDMKASKEPIPQDVEHSEQEVAV